MQWSVLEHSDMSKWNELLFGKLTPPPPSRTDVNPDDGQSDRLTYLLTDWLTYSMEQSSSWEANWLSASQEIPRILWNPMVHYHNCKCLPPVPILSQINPVHVPPYHSFKIHFNLILPFYIWMLSKMHAFHAPPPTSWRSILILSSHLHLGLPSESDTQWWINWDF